jgi:hypothetical protein
MLNGACRPDCLHSSNETPPVQACVVLEIKDDPSLFPVPVLNRVIVAPQPGQGDNLSLFDISSAFV